MQESTGLTIVVKKQWPGAFGLFYIDATTKRPLIRQACFYANQVGEVAFSENASHDPDLARTFERQFCQEASLAGVHHLWADCPEPLAKHYEATYPGWHITGASNDIRLGVMARVEKDLTEWEV